MDQSGRLDLTEMMTRLAGLLFSEETLQSALHLTVRLVNETFPKSVGAGVTLIHRNERYTAAYSDELVAKADELQYSLDEGPCLSAHKDNQTFRIDDMDSETRWARWTPTASTLGLKSVVSAPLRAHGAPTGAIKVYSDHASSFNDLDEDRLLLFADQAAVVLANVEGYADAHVMSDQLKDALLSRDVIGTAKGILMEREGIDDEAAFAMLRQASQTRNIKLREIALAVVETTRRSARGTS